MSPEKSLKQKRSSLPWHGGPLRGLRLAESDGSSGVEYSVLIGLCVIVLMTSVLMLGQHTRRTFRSAAVLGTSSVQVPGARGVAGPLFDGHQPQTDHGKDYSGWKWMLLAGASLASIVLLLFYRKRRRKQATDPEADEDDTGPEDVPESINQELFKKRQVILRRLLNDPDLLLQNRMKVKHLAGKVPVCASSREPCADVLQRINEENVHYAVVRDTDPLRVGIVGRRALEARKHDRVAKAMTLEVTIMDADLPIAQAAAKMMSLRQLAIPVVSEGVLTGILTKNDLVVAFQCSLQMFLRAAQVNVAEDVYLDMMFDANHVKLSGCGGRDELTRMMQTSVGLLKRFGQQDGLLLAHLNGSQETEAEEALLLFRHLRETDVMIMLDARCFAVFCHRSSVESLAPMQDRMNEMFQDAGHVLPSFSVFEVQVGVETMWEHIDEFFAGPAVDNGIRQLEVSRVS